VEVLQAFSRQNRSKGDKSVAVLVEQAVLKAAAAAREAKEAKATQEGEDQILSDDFASSLQERGPGGQGSGTTAAGGSSVAVGQVVQAMGNKWKRMRPAPISASPDAEQLMGASSDEAAPPEMRPADRGIDAVPRLAISPRQKPRQQRMGGAPWIML
jgi:hypothetical protein